MLNQATATRVCKPLSAFTAQGSPQTTAIDRAQNLVETPFQEPPSLLPYLLHSPLSGPGQNLHSIYPITAHFKVVAWSHLMQNQLTNVYCGPDRRCRR